MADKKDHGKVSYSTERLLKDLFLQDEAARPDHLLHPNSPEKKRREAQKFYDMLYHAALLESIRIYERFIFYLKVKQKQLDKIVKRKPINLTTILLPLPKTNLVLSTISKTLETQIKKLKTIKEKLKKIITALNNKIEKTTADINHKKDKINHLKNETVILKQTLSQQWINHFKRLAKESDITIQFNMPLPEAYANHSKNLDRLIKIDRDIYIQFTETIEQLADKDVAISDIHLKIKSILENKIKNELRNILMFIPEEEREKIINTFLKDKDIQFLITKYIWHDDLIRDHAFIQDLIQSYKNEQTLSILQVELKNEEIVQENLLQLKEEILAIEETQLKKADELIATIKEYSAQFDRTLDSLEAFIDAKGEQIDLLEKTTNEEIAEIYPKIDDVYNFMQELDALELEAENMLKIGIDEEIKEHILVSLDEIHKNSETSFNVEEKPILEKKEPVTPEGPDEAHSTFSPHRP